MYYAANLYRKQLPDFWNLCPDLDDLSVVSMVVEYDDMNVVFDSVLGQGHMIWFSVNIKFPLDHYFLNIFSYLCQTLLS